MGKVVMYSKAGCGQCVFTKKELTKKGVDYEERRVDLNEEHLAEMKALGFSSLPLVVPPVGEPFTGFNPTAIKKMKLALEGL